MILDLIAYKENSNDELAVGDLVGYIYEREIEQTFKDGVLDEDLFDENLDTVLELNSIFIRLNVGNKWSLNQYYELIDEEVEKRIERYPDNEILKNYDKRTVLEEYQR